MKSALSLLCLLLSSPPSPGAGAVWEGAGHGPGPLPWPLLAGSALCIIDTHLGALLGGTFAGSAEDPAGSPTAHCPRCGRESPLGSNISF